MKNLSTKPIATWLTIGVIMVIIQIILGGITRLTGSGLSITEWNVGIEGMLPPLNQSEWNEAFDKYKTTEQYRVLNSGFTLEDFKFIFFWEWFHRLWGRLIGVVFAIPFIIFLVQRRFRKEMILPLIILFLLGALQGAVGWIMVASGLTGDAIYVRPTRLGMHFVLALILLAYTYWFALKFRITSTQIFKHISLHRFTWVLLALLFFQLFYGALMAGYKAAVYAPTWPDINGAMVPPVMTEAPPASADGSFEERKAVLTTHFIHRTTAYLLVLLVIGWTVMAYRTSGTESFRRMRFLPLLFVLVQTALGIFTVLSSTGIKAYIWNEFEWNAQLHQLVAIFLLLSLVHALFLLSPKQKVNS